MSNQPLAAPPREFTFTVFTPTYNRAGTLHRVYESLRIAGAPKVENS